MSSLTRLLVIAIGLLVSGAAIAFLFITIDIGTAVDVLRGATPLPLIGAFALLAVELGLRALRWAILLPAVDGRRISPRRLVPVLLVGYLGNAVLPARLGEPLRAVLVSRREHTGVAESLGSVVLERIIDVAVLAVLALAATSVLPPLPWVSQTVALAAAGGIGILLVLSTVGIGRLVGLGRRFSAVQRSPRLSTGFAHLERFAHQLGGRHRRRAILAASAISAVAWLLDGAIFWLVGQSLGIELPYAGALLIAGVTVLSTAVPAAPGFVGTFEVAGVAAAGAIGVPTESALALVVLTHAATLGPLALGGAVSLAAMGGGLRDALREVDAVRAR